MAAPDRSAGDGCGFPHAAHLHAKMMGFKKNRNTVRVQYGFQCVCNLLANALLHGKRLEKSRTRRVNLEMPMIFSRAL